MRASRFSTGATLVLAGLWWSGPVPQALGQQALCPTSPLLSNGVQASEVSLQRGLCTNFGTASARTPAAAGGFPTGAFSGAALATQALSELTQATTLEATRSVQDSISKRRDEEKELCSAGFTLVGGACETGRSVADRAAPEGMGRYGSVPTGGMVDSSIRFSSWAALHGDYERRSADGSAHFTVGAWGGGTMPLDLPISVRTRTGTVGFTFGGDATTRGLMGPDDGLIAGLTLGYLTADVAVATSSGPSRESLSLPAMGPGSSRMRAALAGLTTGAYLTYFNGGFSTDLLLKADVLTLDESFNDSYSFTHPGEGQPPLTSSFSGAGRFSLTNTTLAGNINHRFIVQPSLWIEPTVGAQYTHSAYGNGAADFGLDDADLVRVQGGARVGIPVAISARTLLTTTLTGLAYSDVLVNGGFVPGAGFLANNILAAVDQGQVRGRGVVAVTLDYGNGVSSFIQGEARGGKGLFGAGGRAGIRIVW
jgi:hypothetical protein